MAARSSELTQSKAALRAWAWAEAPVSSAESQRVVDGLVEWLQAQPATGVLAYVSMTGEIAADAVAGLTNHRLYTTRTPRKGPLTVHPWDAPRVLHPYGFEQPMQGAAEADLGDIGIVLVPGLVFDRAGRRLGRGKGYYDRLLADLPGRVFAAVTLERFVVDAVPVEDHDQLMTHLATERGVVRVGLRL